MFTYRKMKQTQPSYSASLFHSLDLIYGCSSTPDLVLELTYLNRVLDLVEVNSSTTTVTSAGSL